MVVMIRWRPGTVNGCFVLRVVNPDNNMIINSAMTITIIIVVTIIIIIISSSVSDHHEFAAQPGAQQDRGRDCVGARGACAVSEPQSIVNKPTYSRLGTQA
eukprot:923613-Rhodomonas_salina.1